MLKDGTLYNNLNSKNPIQAIINILTCVAQIYRHIYEPFLQENEVIKWWNSSEKINNTDLLKYIFSPIFKQVPVTFSDGFILNMASKSDFSNIDFSGCDLRNIGFQNSKLTGAKFSDTILCGCDFSETVLKSADFSNADIHYASLKNAVIKTEEFGDIYVHFWNAENAWSIKTEEELKGIAETADAEETESLDIGGISM